MTLEDAAIDLATEFSLSSPLEGFWLIDLDPANVTGHTLPRTSFGSGFFTTDPLHAVAVQMADPDPLAEAAEQSGFPAATSTVNTGQISPGGGASSPADPEPIGNCLRGAEARAQLKDAIASGTNAYLSGNASTILEIEAVAFDAWQSAAACCVPWTWSGSSFTCSSATPWALIQTTEIETILTHIRVCTFKRTVYGIQTRISLKRCFSCSFFVYSQTRSVSQVQTVEDRAYYTLPAAPPPCPAPPGNACTLSGSVTGTTSFMPPEPQCP
jgi:hypothetical protein